MMFLFVISMNVVSALFDGPQNAIADTIFTKLLLSMSVNFTENNTDLEGRCL